MDDKNRCFEDSISKNNRIDVPFRINEWAITSKTWLKDASRAVVSNTYDQFPGAGIVYVEITRKR
jgi:hypothetical protein